MEGFFVTLEGVDGCGKSTQARHLVQALKKAGRQVIHTREPGGTPLGVGIRQLFLDQQEAMGPQAELFLMAADRSEHVRQVIVPALEAGAVVVCERYTDSTEAYQGYGRGLSVTRIRRLNDWATGGVMPHVTFLLDVPVIQAIERRSASADRIEQEEAGFFERVRQGYVALSREFPKRIAVIDGTASAEQIHRQIMAILAQRETERRRRLGEN